MANRTIHSGLHHISLKACGGERFRAVLEFYRDVLECPVVRSWGEDENSGALLDLGGVLLEVTANGPPGLPKGPFGHIAFAAEDVDALTERARQAGRTVFQEPADKRMGGRWPVRVAFCTGPAGEQIEFFKEYPSSPAEEK